MHKTLGTHNYYVYILTNKKKTVLYTGFTNELKNRLYYHQNPEAHSKAFTTKYRCYYLIYFEHYQDAEIGIDREKEIKGWTRAKKDALISEFNPEWRFLNDEIED
jgi:putative endonuclease